MSDTTSAVVPFPAATPPKTASSTTRIWGKTVVHHGYAGVPSILIRSQARLGLSPL